MDQAEERPGRATAPGVSQDQVVSDQVRLAFDDLDGAIRSDRACSTDLSWA